ncbi:MAG TPA: hypothetical protein PLI34_05665, partial [Saprospiraceae bacterium]|nr:hypothetical protein [Saprospiraceae bacterium]
MESRQELIQAQSGKHENGITAGAVRTFAKPTKRIRKRNGKAKVTITNPERLRNRSNEFSGLQIKLDALRERHLAARCLACAIDGKS